MFSANENIQLRKHKRQIANFVEATMDEEVLEMGVNTMVMQVSCKEPGCVPLETCIVIVFPDIGRELLPGLPESKGGSFKTKILLPMRDVTEADVLEAMPPQFKGGLRTTERLCLLARDNVLGQIGQLFDDVEGRRLLAVYLQTSLQDYMDNDCKAPSPGEPFEINSSSALPELLSGEKNVVIRRKLDGGPVKSTNAKSNVNAGGGSGNSISKINSSTQRRQQVAVSQTIENSSTVLDRLSEREHAPGIRRPGCPCCDPDNPSNVIDALMQL